MENRRTLTSCLFHWGLGVGQINIGEWWVDMGENWSWCSNLSVDFCSCYLLEVDATLDSRVANCLKSFVPVSCLIHIPP